MNPENLWINNVITICAIVFAVAVILFFMWLDTRKEGIKPSGVVAFIGKYSLAFGAVFIIIGLVFWLPILSGYETMFGYKQQDFWENAIVIINTAYFNPHFFIRAFLGLSALIIGIIFIVARLFRSIERFFKGVIRWLVKQK